MTFELVLGLVGLALVDSTSFSAFGVPVFLLLSSPTPPIARMLTYLATVVIFFFVLGVAIMIGLDTVLASVANLLETRTAAWVQLFLGIGLFAMSFRFDSKRSKRGFEAPSIPAAGGLKVMIALGLTTSVLELATMLPFIAALGLLTAANLPATQWAPLLAGYTVVMVLPPVVMLVASIVARDWFRPHLERVSTWLQTHGRDLVGWTLGIVGFLLAADAANRLGLFEILSR